jgi:drug/metabolite transporter (DMT)-like permease
VQKGQISCTTYFSKIFPISLLFSVRYYLVYIVPCVDNLLIDVQGGLVFGNSAYKYISVAYLQIMKSMTPVPTLLVSFLIGREAPTWTQLIIVVC